MPLIVIGLNHKTADVSVREQLSVPQNAIAKVVAHFCQQAKIRACVIISTCNRTEFYLSANQQEIVIETFCDYFEFKFAHIEKHIYLKQNQQCIEHLFTVASGLDSLVIGEAQILGQVKSAYDSSKQAGFLNNSLDRMFQTAFRVAKTVRSTTDIGKNPVSVANSAVLLSKQILGKLEGQNILVIGAGSTAELLVRYLHKHLYHKLTICNRTLGNAKKLATQFNAESFELSQLSAQIADYDLIFTATASNEAVITAEMIKPAIKQRKHKPIVIIDIAIPRDVEEKVKKFSDIFYYSVDDLQKVISHNLQSRQQAALIASEIIKAEAESFLYWLKAQQHTQLINNFQRETAKIRKASLDKALKQLKKGDNPEDVLFALANNLTKKLNHTPVKAIRTAIGSGDSEKIAYMKQLLELDKIKE